jgi:hypothetical protein
MWYEAAVKDFWLKQKFKVEHSFALHIQVHIFKKILCYFSYFVGLVFFYMQM